MRCFEEHDIQIPFLKTSGAFFSGALFNHFLVRFRIFTRLFGSGASEKRTLRSLGEKLPTDMTQGLKYFVDRNGGGYPTPQIIAAYSREPMKEDNTGPLRNQVGQRTIIPLSPLSLNSRINQGHNPECAYLGVSSTEISGARFQISMV